MDLIRLAMNRPVTITVSVLMVILFGLIGLSAIPIQLTPTVDRPVITISTVWPGRSPQEVMDDITKEQEQRLKNVSNLKSMRSLSQDGQSQITLEFYLGSNINRALQEVADALRQVPQYPDEVDEPVIKAAEGSAQNAIAWIIIDIDPTKQAAHAGYDITQIFDALDKEVRPYLERIDGIAEVNVFGGRQREVRALIDPTALAQRNLSYNDVIAALRNANRNVSAGTIAEGKRDYRVRVLGQFATADDVLETIVAYRDGKPVYLKDIGTAEIGHVKSTGFVRSMGVPCIAMNVIRQGGANVMSVMADLRARLEEVKTEILPRIDAKAGGDLRLRQVYDETVYIDSAIKLVAEAAWQGGGLAILVLLLFLRSWKSTLIISLAIPISIIGTFLVMLAAGRTLNVISMAGLAFATGVVVDNAVVVLENIDRRRGMGDTPLEAIYKGSREVWGAILAATLAHIAVFVPILTIQEETGQLFFDMALALSVAVALSLVVAVTVAPSFSAVLARHAPAITRESWIVRQLHNLFGLVPVGGALVRKLGDGLYWLMSGWRGWTVRPVLIVLMMAVSLWGSLKLMPPIDYLPAGNQNLVFGGLLIPPGLSVDQMLQYAEKIEGQVGPYMNAKLTQPASVAALPPIFRFAAPEKPFDPVPIGDFFIGGFGGTMFVGGTSQDPQRVIPIGSLLTNTMQSIPDSFGGAQQASIFGGGVNGGNTIDIEISGPNLDRVKAAATAVFMKCAGMYGFGNVRPNPANYSLNQPEYRVRLGPLGRELGLTTTDLGTSVRGLFDGAFAGDFRLDGRNVDLKVLPKGGRLEFKEQLSDIPVMTPSGKVVPLGSVVDIVPAGAAQSIQRIEELPSVTIEIVPPQGKTIGEVMDAAREQAIAPLEQAGLIDRTMRVRLQGTAAKLDEVRGSLFGKPRAAGPTAWWQRALSLSGYGLIGLGAIGAAVAIGKGVRARGTDAGGWSRSGRRGTFFYGAVGSILLGLVLGGVLVALGVAPQLVTARFIWAILVTYFLMCALFEDFLYPFVIMFSVPPAIVGGFAALRIVYMWTMSVPTIAPQQFDVLTMLGFVILLGTVVSNAILIVEQSLNFMHPPEYLNAKPMEPMAAIAESVRSRLRPIFMTTLTTIGGGLPLVVSPGAGSEMYRGLGAVICGGLLVSTLFTLVLVPMVFSITLQMREGLGMLLGRGEVHAAGATPAAA